MKAIRNASLKKTPKESLRILLKSRLVPISVVILILGPLSQTRANASSKGFAVSRLFSLEQQSEIDLVETSIHIASQNVFTTRFHESLIDADRSKRL